MVVMITNSELILYLFIFLWFCITGYVSLIMIVIHFNDGALG